VIAAIGRTAKIPICADLAELLLGLRSEAVRRFVGLDMQGSKRGWGWGPYPQGARGRAAAIPGMRKRLLTIVSSPARFQMMHEAAVTEFDFVQSLPKREKSKLVKVWEHFKLLRLVAKQKGMLIPQHYAAEVLGVSRQRVHVLVNEGRLESVDVGGCRYVTEDTVVAYAQAERKAGRRVAAPDNSQLARFALDEARRSTRKIVSESH